MKKTLPKILVCLASKGDEKYLPKFLENFSNLDYPKELLRFVVIYGLEGENDRTKEIFESCFQKNRFSFEIHLEPSTERIVTSRIYASFPFNEFKKYLKDEEYVLLLDTDIKNIPPETLKVLLSYDKDIIAPFPYYYDHFFDTTVFRTLDNRSFSEIYGPFKREKENLLFKEELMELGSVGTLLLCKSKVLREAKFGDPYPFLQFCWNARKLGYRVWATRKVRIEHMIVNESHPLLEDLIKAGKVPATELEKMKGPETLPTVSIIMHSKGSDLETIRGLKSIRNIRYPHEKLDYLVVVPNEEDSIRPIKEYLGDRKLTLLFDKWISEKYKGINLIGQAWRQLQRQVNSDLVLFTDNDIVYHPPDLIYRLLEAKVPWDVIGPLTLVEGTETIADSYPFEKTREVGKYWEMKGYCMVWLAKTKVFKSVRITDPDPYYTTFRKLYLMGYNVYIDPTVKCYHSRVFRRNKAAKDQNWNWRELVELGYFTEEDLDYYFSWVGKENPLGRGKAAEELRTYPRGDPFWKKKFGRS